MKSKAFLVLAALALAALPVLGQEAASHNIQFDFIGFSFEATLGSYVNIQTIPGDPTADAGPGFSDAAKTQFTFYDWGQPSDSIFETGGLRVYRTADIARYDFLQTQVDQLEDLLAAQPTLTALTPEPPNATVLPYLPVLPHGQTFAARAHYVDTGTLRGIGYLTDFQAALGPIVSGELLYTFQGISSDGQYYVTVNFPLNSDLFPADQMMADPAQFQQQWPTYLAESIAQLEAAAPESFTPSLNAVDSLIQSIHFAA